MYYRLDDNKNVIPCTIDEYIENTKEKCRNGIECESLWKVDQTIIGDYFVSTVFLSIDHRWGGTGKPIVFETMIKKSGDGWLDYQERYSTWDEAVEGHKRAIEWVKNGCIEEFDEEAYIQELTESCDALCATILDFSNKYKFEDGTPFSNLQKGLTYAANKYLESKNESIIN